MVSILEGVLTVELLHREVDILTTNDRHMGGGSHSGTTQRSEQSDNQWWAYRRGF